MSNVQSFLHVDQRDEFGCVGAMAWFRRRSGGGCDSRQICEDNEWVVGATSSGRSGLPVTMKSLVVVVVEAWVLPTIRFLYNDKQ